MDTVSARQGLCVDRGWYKLELDEAGNVRGTGTVEGSALAGRAAVVFALSPGITVAHVEVDGVAAAVEVDGEGACAVQAHLSPDSRHRVQMRYEGRVDRAFMRDGACGGSTQTQTNSPASWSLHGPGGIFEQQPHVRPVLIHGDRRRGLVVHRWNEVSGAHHR